MRIKAKIAYNHEIGALPRGAVVEETAKRGKALVEAGKFVETTDEVTHGPKAEAAAKAEDAPKGNGGKAEGKAA
ncbi:hypothetical protein HRJ34_00160 [Rhizorhabdus wittichii]|uniref:Uncharacterized protein n=1 Tax=Rhizorhabdus wittichii TaxID=160791 RepID=A0A975D314_9SPHN|nr:hypothetical protein [Rhizorhabdus wittichii]QTH21992.1 hypothetical protein HRJ34_00160 [Rhizorhabdus wittichii]